MKKIFFDDVLQNKFLKQGFVTIPLLSADEVNYLLSEMKTLNPADKFAPEGFYHSTLLDSNLEYKRKAAKIVRELLIEKIGKILVDYKIMTSGLIVKQPLSGEVPIHRDWTFTDNFRDTNITVWCPLVDVGEVNGAMRMVDGTHKLVLNIESPHTKPFYSEFSEALKEHSTLINLRAGEAILFESSILHWSHPNNSDQPRPVAGLLCVPNEAQPVFYFPEENRFKKFEMNPQAFEEHIKEDFFEGKIKTKILDYVENKNIEISTKHFFSMLKKGDEIRQNIYSDKKPKAKFWEKVKAVFGRK